jgi:arginyl-tRNA synthetase
MNTKTGDTAVYLLFAFARLSSILRKAVDVRSIDLTKLLDDVDNNYLTLGKRKKYLLL